MVLGVRWCWDYEVNVLILRKCKPKYLGAKFHNVCNLVSDVIDGWVNRGEHADTAEILTCVKFAYGAQCLLYSCSLFSVWLKMCIIKI